MDLLMILTEFDDAGNVVSVTPVTATVVDTPDALGALLDAAGRSTAYGTN